MLFGNQDVTDRVIIENDLAFAFPSNQPIVPGHILICPKRPVATYTELTEPERHDIEALREKLRQALQKTLGAQGFNYAWNEEKIGGQSVLHFHLHVIPRKEGDTGVHQYEPRKFLYRPGTRAESPAAELVEVAKLIREGLV